MGLTDIWKRRAPPPVPLRAALVDQIEQALRELGQGTVGRQAALFGQVKYIQAPDQTRQDHQHERAGEVLWRRYQPQEEIAGKTKGG